MLRASKLFDSSSQCYILAVHAKLAIRGEDVGSVLEERA